MIKYGTTLIAAVALGAGIAGFATGASAHERCGNCGPIAPTTYYRTVHPAQVLTRYRDVSVYRHVNRVRPIVHVTRVQPIVRINEVTRVHHRTIVHTVNSYANYTQYLRPVQYVSHSVQNIYHCGCAP